MSIIGQALLLAAAGGLTGWEIETGTYTPTSNAARPTISFAKTHDTTPVFVAMAMDSATTLTDNNRNYVWMYFDFYRLFGGYIPGSPSNTGALQYGRVDYTYSTSNGSLTSAGAGINYNSDNPNAGGTNYARYWATESAFMPSSNSNSRYWGNGKTFKWIAIWKKST